jgi:hypothetical protein
MHMPPQSNVPDGERLMAPFDWHSGEITRATIITGSYRNTQKVRRFFRAERGDDFKFDRTFMAWMKAADGLTMGDAVAEWRRRDARKSLPRTTPNHTRDSWYQDRTASMSRYSASMIVVPSEARLCSAYRLSISRLSRICFSSVMASKAFCVGP